MKDLLAADETVINPYYMRQLLQYGIKLGEVQNSDMTPESLLREAEVRPFLLFYTAANLGSLQRLVAELKSIQP